MSIASEFWRSTISLVEDRIQKYTPFRAKVTSSSGGLVQIRTYDSDNAMSEKFPQLHGVSVGVGDEVAVMELGGKPFVLGRIRRNLSGDSALNNFEGAVLIDSSASNALTITNRLTSAEVFRVNADTKGAVLAGRLITDGLSVSPTSNATDSFVVKDSSGSDVFRVNSILGDAVLRGKLNASTIQIQPLSNTNGTFMIRDSGGGDILIIDTPSGNASLKGTMAIDGVTANKASLTAPRFQAWSSATSTVTSTTNTTTYQTAMTRSFTLPEGTWSVYVVAGQQLRHSADGGIAFRTNIGTSEGGGIVTGFYSTNYVQGISTHQISGQTGTINIAVEYRCSSAGTSTSKAPWMYMCAVRTA